MLRKVKIICSFVLFGEVEMGDTCFRCLMALLDELANGKIIDR